MTKNNVVKLALCVGVCAILASVVMLGACGGSEMTDDDVTALFNAIRNTEEYEGSYTFTDTYTDKWTESYEDGDDIEDFAYVDTEGTSSGYDSSTKDYWYEYTYKSVDSEDGTYSDADQATYRVVDGESATIYQKNKNRLRESSSYQRYYTIDLEYDYTNTSLYSKLPYFICRYVQPADSAADPDDEETDTLDDFLSLVYAGTYLSYNADPDYYTCTVSGNKKITYTFSLNYKYSFNTNGIKETRIYKCTAVFTVVDNMLTGYKTSGTTSYSLGDRTKVEESETYEREITISYEYTDGMPKDFSDYESMD